MEERDSNADRALGAGVVKAPGREVQGRLTNMRSQEEDGEQQRGLQPDHTPEADCASQHGGAGVSHSGSGCSACAVSVLVLGRKRK